MIHHAAMIAAKPAMPSTQPSPPRVDPAALSLTLSSTSSSPSTAPPPNSSDTSSSWSSWNSGDRSTSIVRGRGRSILTVAITRPGRGRHHGDLVRKERSPPGCRGSPSSVVARPFGPDALQLEVEPLPGHRRRARRSGSSREGAGPAGGRGRGRSRSAAHPAGEVCRAGALEAAQSHQVDQRIHSGGFRATHPGELEREADVGGDGAPAAAARVLERDTHREVLARRRSASSPCTRATPVVGVSSPARMRSTVDLPHPDGPR